MKFQVSNITSTMDMIDIRLRLKNSLVVRKKLHVIEVRIIHQTAAVCCELSLF